MRRKKSSQSAHKFNALNTSSVLPCEAMHCMSWLQELRPSCQRQQNSGIDYPFYSRLSQLRVTIVHLGAHSILSYGSAMSP